MYIQRKERDRYMGITVGVTLCGYPIIHTCIIGNVLK